MQWSRALPVREMLGTDGSLLALANRAGMVALWSCGIRLKLESRLTQPQVRVRAKVPTTGISHRDWGMGRVYGLVGLACGRQEHQ